MCKIVVFAAHSFSFYRSYCCHVESGANLARKTDGKIHFMRQTIVRAQDQLGRPGDKAGRPFFRVIFHTFLFPFFVKEAHIPSLNIACCSRRVPKYMTWISFTHTCKYTKLPFEVSGSFLLTVLYHVACWKLSYRNHRRLDHNAASRLLWKLDKQISFSSRTFWKLIS